ncbi:MAG: DUF3311 domain-containing protein [Phycisphaerae bacterium]
MKNLIYTLIILLAVLHHDFWWWDTATPFVFGFIPIGLAYHALISLLAAGLWALAIKYCWPQAVDDTEPDTAPTANGTARHPSPTTPNPTTDAPHA